MMTIDVSNGKLDIILSGWDIFWCVKTRLTIPIAHVKRVAVRSAPPMSWKHLRAPGTSWPGKIRAGSYWSWETHEWSFWNIRKAQRVVVIELVGEKYSRLVMEVGDPEELRDQIQVERMEETL